MSPAGRRPGAPATREAILAAARAEFAKGYTAASVRAVAREAGVDPALVYHYFSDKAGLFVACFELPADPRAIQARAGGAAHGGARIVEAFLAQWEPQGQTPGASFVTLTQAVSSAPEAARALREFLTERVWANRPQGAGPESMRIAGLVSSQLLGLAWTRYIVRMEPIASASRHDVARWAGPGIDAIITAAGTGPAPRQPPAPGRRARYAGKSAVCNGIAVHGEPPGNRAADGSSDASTSG
jgi:AcrR family transcriptional regulator